MRAFVENRIKPYYLHHPDLAPGTAHLRVDIATGQALMRALRGHVSGLCVPEYVLDIPGGHGKSPIGPRYLGDPPEGTEAPLNRLLGTPVAVGDLADVVAAAARHWTGEWLQDDRRDERAEMVAGHSGRFRSSEWTWRR